jgi:CHAD domain-containing protein
MRGGTRWRTPRTAAREAFASPRYARAIVEISQWLANPGKAADDGTLEDFAARLLGKRHKRLAAGLDALPRASMGERHRVRIDAKRLRYVVEGLAPALDAVAARRYAGRLSRIQDSLGRANDAAAGERLLLELEPPAVLAAFAKRWLGERIESDAAGLARLGHDIASSKPFWRHS